MRAYKRVMKSHSHASQARGSQQAEGVSSVPSESDIQLRKSARVRKSRLYLKDFIQ